MDKTIYDLKLHEQIDLGNLSILRVPGGWIYMFYVFKQNKGFGEWDFDDAMFVPYDGEFLNGK